MNNRFCAKTSSASSSITGLTPDTAYNIQISSYSETLESSRSSVFPVKTPASQWNIENVDWRVSYGINWTKSGIVSKPGASKIKLRFREINFEYNSDFINLSTTEKFTGSLSNQTTQICQGDNIIVSVTSDGSINGGFIIDQVMWQGDSATPAVKSGDLFIETANSKPVAKNIQTGSGSGDIFITYDLIDGDNDNCSIKFAYSLDGGANYTYTSALAGDILETACGYGKSVVWKSKNDINNLQNNVVVKIEPSDGRENGTPAVSNVFSINNSVIMSSRNAMELLNKIHFSINRDNDFKISKDELDQIIANNKMGLFSDIDQNRINKLAGNFTSYDINKDGYLYYNAEVQYAVFTPKPSAITAIGLVGDLEKLLGKNDTYSVSYADLQFVLNDTARLALFSETDQSRYKILYDNFASYDLNKDGSLYYNDEIQYALFTPKPSATTAIGLAGSLQTLLGKNDSYSIPSADLQLILNDTARLALFSEADQARFKKLYDNFASYDLNKDGLLYYDTEVQYALFTSKPAAVTAIGLIGDLEELLGKNDSYSVSSADLQFVLNDIVRLALFSEADQARFKKLYDNFASYDLNKDGLLYYNTEIQYALFTPKSTAVTAIGLIGDLEELLGKNDSYSVSSADLQFVLNDTVRLALFSEVDQARFKKLYDNFASYDLNKDGLLYYNDEVYNAIFK